MMLERCVVWLKHHWYVPLLFTFGMLYFFVMAFSRGRALWMERLFDRAMKKHERQQEKAEREITQRTNVRIQQVEDKYRRATYQAQRQVAEEYEQVKQQGPQAVEAWLQDFDKKLREGG